MWRVNSGALCSTRVMQRPFFLSSTWLPRASRAIDPTRPGGQFSTRLDRSAASVKPLTCSTLQVYDPHTDRVALMIRKLLHFTVFIFSVSTTQLWAATPPSAADIVRKAKEECAALDNGQFHATEQAVSRLDLTGDGQPEEFIDASQFSCSTAASMWGGSGGTFLWVIVAGEAYEFLAHRWTVVDMAGQNVLLLAVHSSQCGDDIGPCYRAHVWDEGFRTTR